MAENAPPKVAVFIDWQNAYKTAREAFGLLHMPNEHGNFSPYRLARLLAAGNGRGKDAGNWCVSRSTAACLPSDMIPPGMPPIAGSRRHGERRDRELSCRGYGR